MEMPVSASQPGLSVVKSDGLRYSLQTTVIMYVAYSTIFVLGVVGNALVVVVVRRTPRMRTATNVFITNLACADLMVNLLCLPFTLLGNVYSAWLLGPFICKMVPYLQGVSVAASVHTLVAIAAERCFAICYPMRGPAMSDKACYYTITVIWVFSLAITSPWLVYFRLQPLEEGSSLQVCEEVWPDPMSGNIYFVVAHLVLCYLAPLGVINVCYILVWRKVWHKSSAQDETFQEHQSVIIRTRARVIKMLVVVVLSFAFCWLPLYSLFFWVKLVGPATLSPREEAFVSAMLPISQWLGASNSCINPVLYAYFNKRFRASFQSILRSIPCLSRFNKGNNVALKRQGCVHRREVHRFRHNYTLRPSKRAVMQRRRADEALKETAL
ncbi:neuropeptide SIFamide receptor-like [Cloeon dipterum]|uniref:neuropeptide SIFamide receptor-like n=1 Tax=Cloeon dipterum TaxID=197152 RepID=UPI0032202E16